MMNHVKGFVCAAALAIPMAAVPASAQRPIIGAGNLVNVQVVNVLNNNEIIKDVNVGIGVAAGIAANVCGTTVQAVTVVLAQGQDFECQSDAGDQVVNITQ